MTTQADELRTLRRQNRLTLERVKAARLGRLEKLAHRQLTESITLDWVQGYAELLDRWRGNGDPIFQGPAAYWNRRYGKDWPIHQTEQELALFRAPSRVLCATTTDAQALIWGTMAYVIGSGYTYRWAIRDAQSPFPAAVVAALQRVTDDIQEHNSWKGGESEPIEAECFWRSLEDGEFGIRNHPQPDGMTEFRIFEPEQLTQPPGGNYYDWSYGVCTDPQDVQKPLAYWLQYGDSQTEGDEVSPDEITHLRRNGRRGMKRGIPDFTFSTYTALQLSNRIRIALGTTGSKQASVAFVLEHENGSIEDIQAFRDQEADYQTTDPLSGQTVDHREWRPSEGEDIPKGMKYVDGPGAPYSPNHLAILKACQNGAVGRWSGFEWLISGDATTNNLPTDLSNESKFVRRVLLEQNRYTSAFKKCVLAAVRHYVETKGLWVGGREYTWAEIVRECQLLVEAPTPVVRNKLEESQRGLNEIAAKVQSPQAYMQEQGRDPARIEADLKAWEQTHPQPTPAPPPEPKPRETTESRELQETHAPDPPFPGGVWDESKKHWVKPVEDTHELADHEGGQSPHVTSEDDHYEIASTVSNPGVHQQKLREINSLIEHQDALAKEVGAGPEAYKSQRKVVVATASDYLDHFRDASQSYAKVYAAEADYESAKQGEVDVEDVAKPRPPRDPAKKPAYEKALDEYKVKKKAAIDRAIEAKRRDVQAAIVKVKEAREAHRKDLGTLDSAREKYVEASTQVSHWLMRHREESSDG